MNSVALLTAICALGATPPSTERFFGIARSEDGRVLYRETHEVVRKDDRTLRAVTKYFDARGKLIAELQTKYDNGPFAPSYRFIDASGQVKEAVKVDGERLRLRSGRDAETLPVPRPDEPPLVLGQGLAQLAKAELDRLARGEEMTVSFAIPSRLAMYDFRVRAVDSPDPKVVRLRVEIDDWFLRLLAPSLEVDYDKKTRRLLEYRGVSNLTDREGDNPKVVIRYDYPEGRDS